MRYIYLIIAALCIISSGCKYTAPVAEDQGLDIDNAVLGLWQESGEDSSEKMLVMKSTETGYIVNYPMGDGGLYYRAYPVKLEGKTYVQFQLIGNAKGDLEDKSRKYDLAKYSVSDGKLELRLLNTDVISTDIKDSKSLKKAFLKNHDKGDLFDEPGKFTRVETK